MAENLKIKIKSLKPQFTTKFKLIELCSTLKIKLIKVIEISNGFLAICSTIEDGEKLFNVNATEILTNSYFQPILPQELMTKRSVFIKNIDEFFAKKV